VSNFALSEDGSDLFYGHQIGDVVAWRVAEPEVPSTEAPVTETESPTMISGSETFVPSAGATTAPTVTPRVESPLPRLWLNWLDPQNRLLELVMIQLSR
jgi:hypothetical protein